MESILTAIKDYADRAHGEQMRKYTPERYIVHPIRVMQTVKEYDERLPMLSAALLHDVLEDTPVTAGEMLDFLRTLMDEPDASKTLRLVEELTDVYVKQSYPNLNRKARKQKETERIATTSADSQTIKYADILDNTKEIVSHDPGFAPRFLRECMSNLQVADKGNAELRKRAVEMVENGLRSIKR